MSLSKRLDTKQSFPQRRELWFAPERLAAAMRQHLPEVEFAYVFGSAADGVVPRYSDLDVAVYLRQGTKPGFDLMNTMMATVEGAVDGPVDVDVAVLNTAGPVLRFQALQGRRLFVRPEAMDRYIALYIGTCREYEDYMFRVGRYHRYRREMKAAR